MDKKPYFRIIVFETPYPKWGKIKEILEFEDTLTKYSANELMFIVEQAEKNNNYYYFESHLTDEKAITNWIKTFKEEQ